MQREIFSLSQDECREELVPVVGHLAAEHAIDRVEQLPHHRDQRLQFGFVAVLEQLVKGSQMWVVLHGHKGGHIERPAKMPVAGAADSRWPVH